MRLDGVRYLESLPDKSLDLVTAVCAVHRMKREALYEQLRRVLKTGGRAIWITAADDQPLRFQGIHEDFTRLFMLHWKAARSGERLPPSKRVGADRPVTAAELRNFIQSRGWSNLRPLTDDELRRLSSLVPDDLEAVRLNFEVWESSYARPPPPPRPLSDSSKRIDLPTDVSSQNITQSLERLHPDDKTLWQPRQC